MKKLDMEMMMMGGPDPMGITDDDRKYAQRKEEDRQWMEETAKLTGKINDGEVPDLPEIKELLASCENNKTIDDVARKLGFRIIPKDYIGDVKSHLYTRGFKEIYVKTSIMEEHGDEYVIEVASCLSHYFRKTNQKTSRWDDHPFAEEENKVERDYNHSVGVMISKRMFRMKIDEKKTPGLMWYERNSWDPLWKDRKMDEPPGTRPQTRIR